MSGRSSGSTLCLLARGGVGRLEVWRTFGPSTGVLVSTLPQDCLKSAGGLLAWTTGVEVEDEPNSLPTRPGRAGSVQVLTTCALGEATGTPGGLVLLLPQLKTRDEWVVGVPPAAGPSTTVIISPEATA